MELENLSFKSIENLLYIMRRPLKSINFSSPKEICEIMKNTKQKITVHLYPTKFSRGEWKSLLNTQKWSYHQIYLALKDNKIFCCIGDGDTSAGRARHNELIDFFSSNKKFQKEVPTAVLVTYDSALLAHYFHETYSYVNHDIGSNWNLKIRERVKSAKLPYSELERDLHGKIEVWFRKLNKKALIYRAIREDILTREFDRKIKRKKIKAMPQENGFFISYL